jgi:hypothetical protein
MLRWCMCRMCCATTPRPPGKPPPMRWRKRCAWPLWRRCWPTKARRRRPGPSIPWRWNGPCPPISRWFPSSSPRETGWGWCAPPFRAC